ncbi:MAG: hypothetical protein ACR2Q4_15930, partial [Geminicoccaceae bacterium]
MRHNILGATLICALISAIAPAALSLDSSQPDQHDPSPLARDELYIRDGAVTKFDTCLAVADDTRAFNLWQSTDPEIEALRASDEGGRAEKLAKLPTQLKHQLGFGTIYACAQIIEAWHSLNRKFTFDERFQTTPGPQDGRHHHGTVVVDLTIGKKKSGAKPNHEKADEFEASQV